MTDAPFAAHEILSDTHCGHCNQCGEACPAGAIQGRNYQDGEPRELRLDVARCEAYFQELENAGKLKVCGMCLYACPYGRNTHA